MHDELFKHPAVIARYRAAPYATEREAFLRSACDDGYSTATLQRMAAALLVVAHAAKRNGGCLRTDRLESLLTGHLEQRLGRTPSRQHVKDVLGCGRAFLGSIGALASGDAEPARFDGELGAFAEWMRVECGLSSATIKNRLHLLGRFVVWLPAGVRSVDGVGLAHIGAYMRHVAGRGWSRRSLRQLGSSLRSFFRFGARQGWCSARLATGIELPRLYDLEDVPSAPSAQDIDRLLAAVAVRDDEVAIRDCAVLLLLSQYGLRRGEVHRLCLDDLDWTAETIRIHRLKSRCAQFYPLSARVGEAILKYLRYARPRATHRSLFLTVRPPYRPLSEAAITQLVRRRLTEQGTQVERIGPHSLRHACAGQLLDAGFTMKQIADHLGHRSLNTTRVYTKIDLRGLRQVAELNLGGLL